MLISKYITLPLDPFCEVTGLGRTLVRQMIDDGRLEAKRVTSKKLVIIVQSYLDLLERQVGLPDYDGTKAAIEARKAKREAQAKPERPKLRDVLQGSGLLR